MLWVTLGQHPVLVEQQSVMFHQLTGSPLSNELSQDEKREAIKQSMAGKDILLVLDDVWYDTHIGWFAHLDESTRSRVLLSSRVRGVLASAPTDIVDISLPSEADACSILVGAAGLDHGAEAAVQPPAGAKQIVAMCKRLPLTLAIAGRMIRSLGLEDDGWGEAVELMRSELYGEHGSSAARTAEDNIIATSLKAIRGPQQDNIRLILRAFGLIPEDCRIPLSMLQWVVEAEGGFKPSILNLRRWIKQLIDRSLCLGPVDTPSVHDLILDHATGLHSEQELSDAHRRLVNIIRERRPGRPPQHASTIQAIRRYGWDHSLISDDRQSAYIVLHLKHHVRAAWSLDWADDAEMIELLDDFPNQQDSVPVAAATVLGATKATELATRSESQRKWWSAACRWAAIAVSSKQTSGQKHAKQYLVRAATALESVQPTTKFEQLQKERLEMSTLLSILLYWNPQDLTTYRARCAALTSSEVAQQEPELTYQIVQSTDFFRACCSSHLCPATAPRSVFTPPPTPLPPVINAHVLMWSLVAQHTSSSPSPSQRLMT